MAFSSWRTWITGEVVTAAHMNQDVRDNGAALFPDENAGVSWTPDLEATATDPVTSSVSGRRWRVGPLQFVWARFVMTNQGEGSGTYFVTLPVAASGITGNISGQVIGSWRGVDASAAANSGSGAVILATLSPSSARFGLASGQRVTESAPFTWNVDDVLTFQAVYPTA